MATTIITKYGSGAPAASDVVRGELAVDTENKRLYTEDSGGSVVELGTNPAANVTFGDNVKAVFGAGSDLEIYHDATDSIINDNGTGSLKLQQGGSTKLEVTTTGIDVTGVITTDGMTTSADINFGDNDKAIFGTGSDLEIYSDGGANNYVVSNNGALILRNLSDDKDIYLQSDDGAGNFATYLHAKGSSGEVILKHYGSNRLGTTSTGIDVTGTVTADGLTVGASVPTISFEDTDGNTTHTISGGGNGDLNIAVDPTNTGLNSSNFRVSVDGKTFQQIDATGDISFYEDTGTTAKLFWDASAESLGIGTDPSSYDNTIVADQGGNYAGLNDQAAILVRASSGTSGDNQYHGAISFSKGTGQAAISAVQEGSDSDVLGLTFWTHASSTGTDAAVERMRIDASGNVGIGTDSPASPLHVSATNDIARFQGSDAQIIIGNSSAGVIDITSAGTGDDLAFGTNSTERMRIDSSGQVGIGTTTPTKNLHVYNATTNRPALIESGDADSLIEFKDNSTTNSPAVGATGNDFIVQTGSSATERMRIDSSGNLLVGCTGVPSASVAGFAVRDLNNGWIHTSYDSTNTRTHHNFFNPNGSVGTIQTSGSSTLFNTSSDQRLKENIVDAPSASDDIDAIQVRSFDWKADGSHQKYGMVAQELVTVAPSAVSQPEDPQEMMSVDYSKLVPMMLKEIQQLRARVAQLEGV